MAMNYLLIIVTMNYSSHIEFRDKASCEFARQEIAKSINVSATCVPRNLYWKDKNANDG